jgi:hypothetical protein
MIIPPHALQGAHFREFLSFARKSLPASLFQREEEPLVDKEGQ